MWSLFHSTIQSVVPSRRTHWLFFRAKAIASCRTAQGIVAQSVAGAFVSIGGKRG
jgi:hypothetical protein